MTELEKREKVNMCSKAVELSLCVVLCANSDWLIEWRSQKFDAWVMADRVYDVIAWKAPANVLTRNYWIRQQALYIKHYS